MEKLFVCNGTGPIVETKYGKIRGFRVGEMDHFYGIKYADAKRWQMPVEVQPWEGIKDATSYGYVAPLLDKERPEGDINAPHRVWPQHEDCQYLNIWAPVGGAEKKPVLVWIHGGGFSGGSSLEMWAYDGKNLAEFGDIIVISLNHRLNILGYFNLSAFGERYWNSQNLGQADIVAALQWVKDNIAAFGGDPDNVTIFGQSGGGGKVNALLQTPAADNLFKRGIIQSGLWREEGFPHSKPDEATLLAKELLKELGLSTIEEMEAVPYDKLAKAYRVVSKKLNEEGIPTGFAPWANDWYIGNALDIGYFTEGAKSKPVLAGTVLAEFAFGVPVKDKNNLSDEERYAIVEKKYGENTDEVLKLFKEAYPEKNIVDAALVDVHFRKPAIDWFDAKAAAGGADNYSFVFAPDFTIDGGRAAWHCAEIPFAFHNVELVPIANIPCADKLEAQVAGAWVNFARTGNPNNPDLPEWKPYAVGDEVTMIFSEDSQAKTNYDRELVELINKVAPPMAPGVLPKKEKKAEAK